MTDSTDAPADDEPNGATEGEREGARPTRGKLALVIAAGGVLSVVLLAVVVVSSQSNAYDGPINGDSATFDEFAAQFPDACEIVGRQDETTADVVSCSGEAVGIPTLRGQIVYQWREELPDDDVLTQWGSETCGLVSGRTVVDYYEQRDNYLLSTQAAYSEFVTTVPATFKGDVTVTAGCPD